eukprot:scaffold137776_cov17-Prasinocladus_malaysianus.AAC.2
MEGGTKGMVIEDAFDNPPCSAARAKWRQRSCQGHNTQQNRAVPALKHEQNDLLIGVFCRASLSLVGS